MVPYDKKAVMRLSRVQAVDFILNRCRYCELQGTCNSQTLSECNKQVKYLKQKYIYNADA